MRRFHLTIGILLLIAFVLTGQFMDRYYNHMEGVEVGLRLLYRTRHIFILFAGLLNLGIGTYYRSEPQRWRSVLQYLGSLLIVVASGLLVAAFFYDSVRADLRTPLTHWAAYLILPGTFCHVIATAGRERKAV